MNSICRKVSVVIIAITMLAAMIPAMQENVFAAKAKKPAKVKKVEISVAEDNSVTVTWKKSKNAKKYVVSVKDGSTKLTSTKKVKSAKLTFQGGNDIKYTIKVRGINGKKKGKWSKAASVTTVDLLADANEAVAKAEADKKAAEEALAKAEADKKAAEEALAKAEADLKAAQDTAKEAGEADKKAAEEAVAKAETDKQAAEDALQEANNKLAAAEQDKKQAVEDAVKEAEEAKKQAEADKEAAEKELGSTKADKEKAEADLKKATDDLENAKSALEKAEKDLADLQKIDAFKEAWNAAPTIDENSTAEDVAAKKAAAELYDALTDDQKALLSDEIKADVEAQKTVIEEREEALRPKELIITCDREWETNNSNEYEGTEKPYVIIDVAGVQSINPFNGSQKVFLVDNADYHQLQIMNYGQLSKKPVIKVNDVELEIPNSRDDWKEFPAGAMNGITDNGSMYGITDNGVSDGNQLILFFVLSAFEKDIEVEVLFNN